MASTASDLEGRVTVIIQPPPQMLGYKPNELLGRSCTN